MPLFNPFSLINKNKNPSLIDRLNDTFAVMMGSYPIQDVKSKNKTFGIFTFPFAFFYWLDQTLEEKSETSRWYRLPRLITFPLAFLSVGLHATLSIIMTLAASPFITIGHGLQVSGSAFANQPLSQQFLNPFSLIDQENQGADDRIRSTFFVLMGTYPLAESPNKNKTLGMLTYPLLPFYWLEQKLQEGSKTNAFYHVPRLITAPIAYVLLGAQALISLAITTALSPLVGLGHFIARVIGKCKSCFSKASTNNQNAKQEERDVELNRGTGLSSTAKMSQTVPVRGRSDTYVQVQGHDEKHIDLNREHRIKVDTDPDELTVFSTPNAEITYLPSPR